MKNRVKHLYITRLLHMIKWLDMFVIMFAGMLAYIIRFNTSQLSLTYAVIVLSAGFIVIPIHDFVGIYTNFRESKIRKSNLSLIIAQIILMLVLMLVTFAFKMSSHISRLWFIYWYCINVSILIFLRVLMVKTFAFLKSDKRSLRRVMIVGEQEFVELIIKRIQTVPWANYQIVGLICPNTVNHVESLYSIPVFQKPANLSDFLAEYKLHEVWLAFSFEKEVLIKEYIEDLSLSAITLRYFPNMQSLDLLRHSVSNLLGFPVITIKATPMIGFSRIIKRIEDISLSVLLLVLSLPLMILVAVLIKLTTPGPVFYRQRRHGADGIPFEIIKFRTMYEHTEEVGVLTQASADDPRITPLGHWLRRVSLDELPQIFNVFTGKMSVVGPRPHAVEHNEAYKNKVTQYMQRHQVKPGITGWAQINGLRGRTHTLDKMEKRIEFDLFYIENWSIIFDIKILCLTLFKGFIGKNAY